MFIFSCTKERKEEVPFSMAIGKGELMHECFPKHSRMGTARMKQDNETDEDGQNRGAVPCMLCHFIISTYSMFWGQ